MKNKQTQKPVTDQRRPWGDTVTQCIVMPGIWSWSGKRTLMENQWNPNKIWSLLNNHVPMSNFFALTHNDKCSLWRKVSFIYTTLNLSLFPNYKFILKGNRSILGLKERQKRRQGWLIDKIPSVLENAIESFVLFQLMGLGVLIVTKSLRKFLKLN